MIVNGTWRSSRADSPERWESLPDAVSAGSVLPYLSARTTAFTYQCAVGPWAWLVVPTCCQYDAIYYFYWLHWSFTSVNESIVQGQAAYVFGLIEIYTRICLIPRCLVLLNKRQSTLQRLQTTKLEVGVECYTDIKIGFQKPHIYPKYNACSPQTDWSLVSLLKQTLVRASLISSVPRDDIFSHLFGG